MKHVFFSFIMVLIGLQLHAQEQQVFNYQKVENNDSIAYLTPHTSGVYNQPIIEMPVVGLQSQTQDTLFLPTLNTNGQVLPINTYPYYLNGWHNWELHPGFNLNMGVSVFGFFGKNAPSGAGFSQSISAMYAMPLTQNLSFAMGGYFNNTMWSRSAYQDVGLSAVLGYRFNDHWEAYLYAQKSLKKTLVLPYPLYDMRAMGDRIGAAVKYNVNPNFSFQLSVEQRWLPQNNHLYFDQYNYPMPPLR